MLNKNFDQISEEDLLRLINNKVLEGKRLEYKQSLDLKTNKNKKEFLADVSAFANASGGDLIYGLSEDKGEPVDLKGLNIENVDEDLRRIDDIIRYGIEPRLPEVKIRYVELSNKNFALIIRVSKSWISPHRVVFDKNDKFYSRSSNGKYPLDVSELRLAFTLSETISERIRKFRTSRISAVLNNETPVLFYDTPKIILHLIPVVSFNPGYLIDYKKVDTLKTEFSPIYSGGRYRYNFDGYLSYSQEGNSKSSSYVQLYKNGIIEAVEGALLKPEDKKVIPRIAYEEELIKSTGQYLSIMNKLNIDLPILLYLTLVNVKGYSMYVNSIYNFIHDTKMIDRDVLLIPEVVIESFEANAETILRPCFDSIWNACGFSHSFNYNEQGEWVGRTIV